MWRRMIAAPLLAQHVTPHGDHAADQQVLDDRRLLGDGRHHELADLARRPHVRDVRRRGPGGSVAARYGSAHGGGASSTTSSKSTATGVGGGGATAGLGVNSSARSIASCSRRSSPGRSRYQLGPQMRWSASRGRRAPAGAAGRGRGRRARSGTSRRRTRSRARSGRAGRGGGPRGRSGSRPWPTWATTRWPHAAQRAQHGLLERALGLAARRRRSCERSAPARARRTRGSGAARRRRSLGVLASCSRRERADDLDAPARTGDGDVQPPLAALAVERAEVHRQLAGLVGAVADAEEDHVALVALDVLEVLDEEAVEAVLVEEVVEALVVAARSRRSTSSISDGLRLAEGDDADAALGARSACAKTRSATAGPRSGCRASSPRAVDAVDVEERDAEVVACSVSGSGR